MASTRERTWGSILIAVVALAAATLPVTGAAAAPPGSCLNNGSLNVPAHQDDDLLFMNPDIQADIDAGRCVVTAFLTAGDAGQGTSYWRGREDGSRAAYARMAGRPDDWDRQTVTIAGHSVVYDELAGRPEIALIFLRLPDGDGGNGYPSTGNESLEKLWTGTVGEIHTVDGSTSYTKASLTAMLAELMHRYQPSVVRSHDHVGKYGDGDHSDHHTSAYFTLAAHKTYFSGPHRQYAYMAYAVANQPANLSTEQRDRKLAAFLAYAPHDDRVCQSADDCLAGGYGARFSRRYTTADELGGRQNVARVATVTGSSQNTGSNQQVTKAIDNVVAGSPIDATREWATTGGKAGSWINASWPTPHTLESVVLYDRPNANDRVLSGTLRFGDGSTVAVGALPNDGAAQVVNFSRRRVTSLRFTVDSVASTTKNIGLAEWQAFSANLAAQAFTSVSSQNVGTGQQGYKVSDGYATGSPAAPTREWATVGGKAGSWLRLTWNSPRTTSRVVLHDRPNGNDRITGGQLTFSDGSSVAVPALPDNGTGLTVTFPARTVTTMQLTITAVSSTTLNVGLAEIQVEP